MQNRFLKYDHQQPQMKRKINADITFESVVLEILIKFAYYIITS